MRTARVAFDPAAVSPSRALARLAGAGDALIVVTGRMFSDIAAELGSYDRAARFLAKVATDIGRPLALNLPTPDGSRTVVVGPRGWSEERTAGWVAARHDALQEMFGPATPSRLEDL